MEFISRHAVPLIREELDTFPCVVIQGARQVGKSTVSTKVAAECNGVAITLDAPSVLRAVRTDPAAFVAQYEHEFLVIDEIQRAPELILPVKASIDAHRRPGPRPSGLDRSSV